MPRFLKERSSSFEQSMSSSGSSTGSTSSRVTRLPNALKTSANSQPTAPAPTMAIVVGACSSTRASSEDMTVVLFSSRPICGSPFTREPVAMTIPFFASCRSSFPSANLTDTVLTTFPPPDGSSFAVPLIHVILCFLNRNSTPFEFC